MEKEGQERCIRQFALNVERNARFRSNLTEQGQCTVEIATRKEGHQEDRIEDTSFRRLIFRRSHFRRFLLFSVSFSFSSQRALNLISVPL
jgi:hypothetical protein